ncbi:hypothetical protein SCHPADRAFT_160170 [Schizopora paradoxa]|uniref:Uncharacterized protein n=1 Tax=Schizopora paradoxa TaxID=27342 RepID=A0A0H2S129_9AGAM|nr:hypothetical protein SCHPADRAFT_160170 [Schizopora paradoxa]
MSWIMSTYQMHESVAGTLFCFILARSSAASRTFPLRYGVPATADSPMVLVVLPVIIVSTESLAFTCTCMCYQPCVDELAPIRDEETNNEETNNTSLTPLCPFFCICSAVIATIFFSLSPTGT